MDVCGSSQLRSIRGYFTCLATNEDLHQTKDNQHGQEGWLSQYSCASHLISTLLVSIRAYL